MKKMMVILMAMVFSANVMAQEVNEQEKGPKPEDKEKMAQFRTDAMVKKYGLNDDQAAKLSELNKAYSDKLRPMRGSFRRPMKKDEADKVMQQMEKAPEMKEHAQEKIMQAPEEKDKVELKKVPARRDFKPGMKEDMRKDHEAYENELKKILTEDQFNAYKEDMQKRHQGQRGPRGHRPHRNHSNQ